MPLWNFSFRNFGRQGVSSVSNKMAAEYSVETYLLDKTNVQDTVIRMVINPRLPTFSVSRTIAELFIDALLRYKGYLDID